MLEKEYDYFLKNKNSLIQKYENRFVVIVGEQVTGDYESEKKALEEATKSYKLVPCPKSFAVHSGNLTYRINQAARSYS